MAQVNPPVDLHATSDIRFVMVEIGKFDERLKGLKDAGEAFGGSLEKTLDRIEKANEKRFDDLARDIKEVSEKIVGLDNKVAWVKGAAWIIGIVLAVLTLFLSPILQAGARRLIG